MRSGKKSDSPSSSGPKEDNLFGPWMVVVDRRRKQWGKGQLSTGQERSRELARGSRFAALVEVEDVERGEANTEAGSNLVQTGVEVHVASRGPGLSSSNLKTVPPKVFTNNMAYVTSNPGKKGEESGVVPLVENEQAVVVEHLVGTVSRSHTAISINEPGYEGHGHSGGKAFKARGSSLRVSKENVKWGIKVHKQDEVLAPSRPVLSNWAANLSMNLFTPEGSE
ncbi:hypothetical protein V6N11_072150 [Hibiscus sabdariffa]|uniref:Uncharacterized protein n=1 Tax=Hibiscus sabdariffa TaxID=183260 RepID=A0ABR2U2X6_9ROSI